VQPTCTPQGWTLRQIGAELGATGTAVATSFAAPGVEMRRSGPPTHSVSTEQILELRDKA
jgi:hypothetical protein